MKLLLWAAFWAGWGFASMLFEIDAARTGMAAMQAVCGVFNAAVAIYVAMTVTRHA